MLTSQRRQDVVFAACLAAAAFIVIAATAVVLSQGGLVAFESLLTDVTLGAVFCSFWGLSVTWFRHGVRPKEQETPFVAVAASGGAAIGALCHLFGPVVDARGVLFALAAPVIAGIASVTYGTLRTRRG